MIHRGVLRTVFATVLSLAISILFFISGCVPVSGTYYRPSASTGKAVRVEGGCGPVSRIRITRSDVVFWIEYEPLEEHPGQAWPVGVGVRFDIPQNKTISLNVNNIAVRDKNGNVLSSPPSLYFFSNGGRGRGISLQADQTTLFGDAHLLKWGYSRYQVFLKLRTNSPEFFFVMVPSMNIGNKHYPKTTVKFTKTRGHWLAGEAC